MDAIDEMIKTPCVDQGSYSKTLSILRKEVPKAILLQLIFRYGFSKLVIIVIYFKTRTSPLSPIIKRPDFLIFCPNPHFLIYCFATLLAVAL